MINKGFVPGANPARLEAVKLKQFLELGGACL